MADFYALLNGARSPDNATRNAAEQALKAVETSDPAAYFTGLARELRNEAREDDVRQLAALRMKVSLDAQDYALREERQRVWMAIPKDVRAAIKADVTATIVAPGMLAKRGAAQVVSKIGYIEITPGDGPEANQWPELLPALVSTTLADALPAEARATALTALGYLLEELDNYDESPLEQAQVDSALTAIARSMQLAAPAQLQAAAGMAMLNTLPFVASNFEDPARSAERDAIMMAICTATTSEDLPVKRQAFACLERVAELYYDHLGPYMKVLADLTAVAARHADEQVAVSALGFWAEVAEEEAERGEDGKNNKFTLAALGPLSGLLLDIMATTVKEVEEDEAESDEFGPAEAAQACLQKVAAAVQDAVVDPVMKFINENFMNPDWRRRDAAIMAFGLIMEGPNPDTLQERYIKEVLPHLLARLKGGNATDPAITVRSSAAFTIAEVFDHHFDVIAARTQFVPLLASLCNALDDSPVVVHQVTRAIDNMVTSAKESAEWDAPGQHGKSIMSDVLYPTINALMTRADKPDAADSGVRTNCYEVISTIVDAGEVADEPVLLALLSDSLTRTQASLARYAGAPTAAAKQAETDVQERLVGLACDILINVAEAARPQADNVMGTMLAIIDARTASEEAWKGISSMLNLLPRAGSSTPAGAAAAATPDATRYIEDLWRRLMPALTAHQEAGVCRAAVYASSDVATALGKDLAPRAPQLLTALIALLSDNNVERDIKPPALAALGDVALALGPAVQPYLPAMHTVIAGAAGVEVDDADDEDLVEYVDDIRIMCLNAWANVLAAFRTGSKVPKQVADEQAQAAAILTNLVAAPGTPARNLMTDILGTLSKWMAKWQADSAPGAGEPEDPPMEQLKKAVVLIGDLTATLGAQALSSAGVTARQPIIAWALAKCQAMEEEAIKEDTGRAANDAERKGTMAAYARKLIPK